MEYFGAVRRNEILLHATTWMPNAKDCMLYNFIYMKCPEKVNLERQKVDYWLVSSGEESRE